MHPMTDEEEQEVVAAYRSGARLKVIEERFGIARSTVYWILQKHQVVANRVNKSTRLTGNDHVLADLYEIIEAQRERIEQLEAEVRELRG